MNINPIIAYRVRKFNTTNKSAKENRLDKILVIVLAIVAFLCAIGALICTITHATHIIVSALGLVAFGCFMLMVMFLIFYFTD